jgi:hypothetical protein
MGDVPGDGDQGDDHQRGRGDAPSATTRQREVDEVQGGLCRRLSVVRAAQSVPVGFPAASEAVFVAVPASVLPLEKVRHGFPFRLSGLF